MMYVALTYDHRIVDGREAVTFLKRIKEVHRRPGADAARRSEAADGRRSRHDLVVIGAGPGGYVAAIRAAQLGLNVACVEKEPALGGTCLRVGCIPSKALLESSELYPRRSTSSPSTASKVGGVELDSPTMLQRKDQVVDDADQGRRRSSSRRTRSRATRATAASPGPGSVAVDGADGRDHELDAKHILIATGSKPAPLARRRARRRPHRHQHRGALLSRGARSTWSSSAPATSASNWAPSGAARREGHGARIPRPHPARHGHRARRRGAEALREAGHRVPPRQPSVTGAQVDGRRRASSNARARADRVRSRARRRRPRARTPTASASKPSASQLDEQRPHPRRRAFRTRRPPASTPSAT